MLVIVLNIFIYRGLNSNPAKKALSFPFPRRIWDQRAEVICSRYYNEIIERVGMSDVSDAKTHGFSTSVYLLRSGLHQRSEPQYL